MPRFGGPTAKRLATGNGEEGRTRANKLQPLAPGTANTDGRVVNTVGSIRANSGNVGAPTSSGNEYQSVDAGPNKINIVAKKRPPPMAIGFNELGIEMSR